MSAARTNKRPDIRRRLLPRKSNPMAPFSVPAALALLGISVTAGLLCPETSSTGDLRLAIHTLTDTHHNIGGALVKLDVAGQASVVKATGLTGQTRFDTAVQNAIYTLWLPPTKMAMGETLGVVYTFSTPVAHEFGTDYVYSITHPVAQDLHITPDETLLEDLGYVAGTQAPFGAVIPEWYDGMVAVNVSPSADYSFNTQIAHLWDGEVIQAYFSYRGSSISLTPYKFGLVLRQAQAAFVGFDEPLSIEVTSPSHTFTSTPQADVFFFPRNDTGLEPVAFVRGHAQLNGKSFVEFVGDLGAGDTVVLLREGPQTMPSFIQVLENNTPVISAPGNSGGGSNSVGLLENREASDATAAVDPCGCGVSNLGGPTHGMPPKDCRVVPPAPAPEFACSDPGAPSDWWDRFGPCEWVAVGQVGCDYATLPRGPQKCMSPGKLFQRKKEKTRKHKFSVGGKSTVNGVTGGYEYERSETTGEIGGFTCPAGANGVGQCFQYFLQAVTCFYKWNHPYHLFVHHYEEAAWMNPWTNTWIIGRRFTHTEVRECASPRYHVVHCYLEEETSSFCDRTIQ